MDAVMYKKYDLLKSMKLAVQSSVIGSKNDVEYHNHSDHNNGSIDPNHNALYVSTGVAHGGYIGLKFDCVKNRSSYIVFCLETLDILPHTLTSTTPELGYHYLFKLNHTQQQFIHGYSSGCLPLFGHNVEVMYNAGHMIMCGQYEKPMYILKSPPKKTLDSQSKQLDIPSKQCFSSSPTQTERLKQAADTLSNRVIDNLSARNMNILSKRVSATGAMDTSSEQAVDMITSCYTIVDPSEPAVMPDFIFYEITRCVSEENSQYKCKLKEEKCKTSVPRRAAHDRVIHIRYCKICDTALPADYKKNKGIHDTCLDLSDDENDDYSYQPNELTRYCAKCNLKLPCHYGPRANYHKSCYFEHINADTENKANIEANAKPVVDDKLRYCEECNKELPDNAKSWVKYHKPCYTKYKISQYVANIDLFS